jgi:exonuclease VII small subunit
MQLSEKCRKQLEEAETRIEILTRKNNTVQAEPFRPDKA